MYVEEVVKHKDQLFFVDSVRPAAGIVTNGGFTMQADKQFFATYDTDVKDETIKDITKIIPDVGEILKNLKKAKVISSANKIPTTEEVGGIPYVDKLTAVKVFDVNLPSLTEDVRAFVDTYVNCSPGCPVPVPPAGR